MQKKLKNILRILILLIFLVTNIYLLISITKLGILPNKYLTLTYIIIALLFFISILLITRKNIICYVLGIIITIIISSGYIIGIQYINKMTTTIDKIASNKINSINYSVLVKNDSNIKNITDLKDKQMGYIKDENSNKLKSVLNKKVSANLISYDNYNTILNDFKTDFPIILNTGYLEALNDEISDFKDSYKIIYTFNIKEKIKSSKKEEKNITVEPFLIYLSGIDTYGNITTRSRSDVNILIAINPKTNKILLVNTPRDYYVMLHGTTGLKDKLTHAGIYGIDKSITTMEDLYKTSIDKYIRVNFNTLIKIVDEIGGIDIVSDQSFTPHTNKNVQVIKGLNHFNGEEALAYSRERYAYSSGDRHRGENQQQVITAIINKVTNTQTLIANYDSILNTLSSSFETNLIDSEIKNFAKFQLTNKIKWDIESISVDGTGSKNYTYSMGTNHLLYVMVPNEDTVNSAKTKINSILEN